MFRHIRKMLYCGRLVIKKHHCEATRKYLMYSISLAGAPLVNEAKSEFGKLEPPDPATLTHTYLIKNASVWTVDAASSLLTQTATALLDIMGRYQDAVQRLSNLLELQLKVLDDPINEVKVWDALMIVRAQVNQLRLQKLDLELVYHSAVTSLQSAAEAAHATGADYAGVTANERVFSATVKLEQHKRKVEDAEATLRTIEAKSVEEISRKAKEKETATKNDVHDDGDEISRETCHERDEIEDQNDNVDTDKPTT